MTPRPCGGRAAAPRSAAASRQDRASRRSATARGSSWPSRRAPPSPPRRRHHRGGAPALLAALVALKSEELLAGPKGSYASSRWQKRRFACRSSTRCEAPARRHAASTWTRWRRPRSPSRPATTFCSARSTVGLPRGPAPVRPSQNDARRRSPRLVGRRAAELGGVAARGGRHALSWPGGASAARCGAASRPWPRGGDRGCAAFLDELGTARGVDLITPVSAKRHDGIVHRAARGARGSARACSRGGARRGIPAAPRATRRRCSPRRPRCSSERAQRPASPTRARRQPAALLPVHGRIHSTARQRDLLTRASSTWRTKLGGRLPRKINDARPRGWNRTGRRSRPPDADALARARFAKVCFAAMCAAARAAALAGRRACG